MREQNSTDWQPYRGVRASAGSGKTYQLTGHYLRSFLAGAEAGELLATTFTRKAAGEILDRVLTRLGGACESDEKLRALASDLGLPGLDGEAARAQMRRLCQSLDEVAISTMDALFGRLLRGYRHELGLWGDLRMEDGDAPEMERLRQDAAADLLAGPQRGAVAGLLDTLEGGEPGRSVIGNLLAWVGRGYELFTTARPEAWELDLDTSGALREAELDTALMGVEALMDEPNGNVRQAVNRNLDAAWANDWAAFLDKGFAKPLLTDEPRFYNKPVPAHIAAAYAPLLGHARAMLANEHLRRHEALRGLLALYDDAYRRRRAEAGVLLFSDVPGLLAGVIPQQADGGPDYRLGHAPRHLLLDEFQDTDPRQYAVLKPFAVGATAPGAGASSIGSLFCVGDRKQSIYGWRGATPGLFDRIEREIPCLAWTNADVSYRSSPAVLKCVNTLFGAIEGNSVLSEKAPDVTRTWQAHFGRHTSSRPEMAGYVELVQFSQNETEAADEDGGDGDSLAEQGEKAGPNLQQAAVKVKAVRDACPGRSIAVLTRTNEAASALLPLLAALGVPAVSESGSRVDDCPAVGLILSALTFADHPGDTAARFHLMNSPLGDSLGLTGEDKVEPSVAALRIREKIVALGLVDLFGRWMDLLAPHVDRRGWDRLTQLVEMADEYSAERSGWHRPAEFVEWARAQEREEPGGAERESGEPVRVMTVHKSKGLEFDVVVLPELSKRLARPQEMVFRRDLDTQEIAALTLRPSKQAAAACPELAALADETTDSQTAEALCLLYVAFTRARYALHLLVPPLEQTPSGQMKATPFSAASILRAGLVGEAALKNMDLPETLWQVGDAKWHGLVPMQDVTQAVATPMQRTPQLEARLPPLSWKGGELPSNEGKLPKTASELLGIQSVESATA